MQANKENVMTCFCVYTLVRSQQKWVKHTKTQLLLEKHFHTSAETIQRI